MLFLKEQITTFWRNVRTGRHQDCWSWMGYREPSGYGRTYINGERIYAHRLSFAIANDRYPAFNKQVLHSCDNTKCVNPAHLREGTSKDNMQDKVQRGRAYSGPRKRGSTNSCSKLVEAQIPFIRDDERASRTIAADYGVSHKTVLAIKNRTKWAHIV